MKRFTVVLFVIAFVSTHVTKAQYSNTDSLKTKKTVRISPNLEETDVNAIGNFIRVNKDTLAFLSNAGQNVLNTLRGHVPNVSSVANAQLYTGGLRSGNPLMVIDGVPYANTINSFYNFTSSEFQNLYTITGASANVFGGLASNGALFFESKTGQNFHRPTFQFTTSPSFNWTENGSSERADQWLLTNALSYQQDFGKIDTRLSYTFTHLPDDNVGSEYKANFHALKLNTGFDITPKFNIRLIIDENRSISKGQFNYPVINGSPITYETKNITNQLQANVNLRYRILDWLLLSSQTMFGVTGDDIENSLPEGWDVAEDQKRLYTNLFLSLTRPLAGKLSFNTFVGSIYETQTADRAATTLYSSSGSSSSFVTESGAFGAGLNLDEYLFLNYSYRVDDFQSLASEGDSRSTFSLTSSFVFSDAFNLGNSWFSLGKLRGSYGDSFYVTGQDYPYTFPAQQPGTYFTHQPTMKTNVEAGIDLGFVNNRIALQATYFNDRSHHNYGYMLIPWGPNGTTYQLIDIGALRTKGVEVVLGTTPIQRGNLVMNTKLIYATLETKIESLNGGNQGGGSTLILANTNPDWRGSLLNQLIFKKFFWTFLIDVRKGGDIVVGGLNPYTPFRTVDGSYTQLRDISFGYTLTPARSVRQVSIALSGRNLWTIDSNSDEHSEGQALMQRGISLNATLTF